MLTIAFTKVSLPYGWLGNMAPFAVAYGGHDWRTTEALFQAMRFAADDPVRELIRAEKSPMAAKMLAKKHAAQRVVVPLTQEDVDNMMVVLRLKVEQHPALKQDLLATGDALIVEDVTKRPGGTGLFWGAALQADGTWEGGNALGHLWMALRDEVRLEPRFARQYILAHPDDCDPPHGLDLTPGSRDSLKVEALTEAFLKNGFDPNEPALVGYALNGRIQLLSGTHRHEAAKRAGILLPIKMHLRSVVEAAWGMPGWLEKLIVDVPVKDLEHAIVQDAGAPPGLDERVDLTRDLVYE
jgi:predicted NAD-dependent protein-ADP-ribosyltransferase YbiA (DUF1768 family)